MATIKFLLQSKSDFAPIYLRLSISRGKVIYRKTGLFINPKEWGEKDLPKQTTAKNKDLATDLRGLKEFILKEINVASANGDEITGNWLSFKIDIHFERISESQQSEYITDVIQSLKDIAKIKKNGKGGIGLSKSRINSYNTLNTMIESFEKRGKFKIKDVDIKFANKFLKFLIETENYSENYAVKKISDLKTVCYHAELEQIKVNPQFKKIETPKAKNNYIVYLSPDELEKIENAKLESESLDNARKWLLLGCNIGQRGGDLLNLTEDNFVTRNGYKLIELQQQKTGKNVTIPVLETTKEILNDGLPYKISIQKLNKHIKKVCEKAKIDHNMEGMVYDKKSLRKKKKVYKKWELITSHVCRRSFATNLYGVLPTVLIMQITAHSTEKMFLNYLGKNSLDYAQQIADFYTLQALKEKKESNLTVVKNASNN